MNGKPLTMEQAWQAYDRLFEDARVCFQPEPPDFDRQLRNFSHARTASPKVWADAYLLAFCACHNAQLITFDRALANRGVDTLMLA